MGELGHQPHRACTGSHRLPACHTRHRHTSTHPQHGGRLAALRRIEPVRAVCRVGRIGQGTAQHADDCAGACAPELWRFLCDSCRLAQVAPPASASRKDGCTTHPCAAHPCRCVCTAPATCCSTGVGLATTGVTVHEQCATSGQAAHHRGPAALSMMASNRKPKPHLAQHAIFMIRTASSAAPAVRHLLPIHGPPLRAHRMVAPLPLRRRRRALLQGGVAGVRGKDDGYESQRLHGVTTRLLAQQRLRCSSGMPATTCLPRHSRRHSPHVSCRARAPPATASTPLAAPRAPPLRHARAA